VASAPRPDSDSGRLARTVNRRTARMGSDDIGPRLDLRRE
jgi:hypothetical protein